MIYIYSHQLLKSESIPDHLLVKVQNELRPQDLDNLPSEVELVVIIDIDHYALQKITAFEIKQMLIRGIRLVGAADYGALIAKNFSHLGAIGIGQVFNSISNKNIIDENELFHRSKYHNQKKQDVLLVIDFITDFYNKIEEKNFNIHSLQKNILETYNKDGIYE